MIRNFFIMVLMALVTAWAIGILIYLIGDLIRKHHSKKYSYILYFDKRNWNGDWKKVRKAFKSDYERSLYTKKILHDKKGRFQFGSYNIHGRW